MEYLADTVTIIRHLTDSGKIGNGARNILNRVEADQATLFISVISLMEIMYLSELNRIGITLSETLQTIMLSTNYIIIDLTPEILQIAEKVSFHELHDRLILSTAKYLNVAVISSDEKFKEIQGIKVIWD